MPHSSTVHIRKFKKRQARLGDTWHIDEVFITIQGQRQYPWSAVDQDGDVIARRVRPVLFAAR
jgi:putative transposase